MSDNIAKEDQEWKRRARRAAIALGLPEDDVERETKAALIRAVAEIVADAIAATERASWTEAAKSNVTFYLPKPARVVDPGAAESSEDDRK